MMKLFTLKGLFLTAVFMLLGCLSIQAADDDLITKQITIKLEQAGTLPNKIGGSKKYKITNLKIVGEINGTDWSLIRDMAGSSAYEFSKDTEGKLSELDLSEAKIVEGGDYYFYTNNYKDKYYTSNDCLGPYALYGCKRLVNIALPSNIVSIGEYAFGTCEGLTSVDIPNGITSISNYAFEYCRSLTSLVIPSNVVSIGQGAFLGCNRLISISIPSSVTSIGSNAFSLCSRLSSITLPSSITKMGETIFYDCSRLTSVTLPSKLPSIGMSVFEGCTSLVSITLPSGVTSIGFRAFYNCNSLTSIIFSSDVVSIANSAFQNCSSLRSVTLPSSVTSIGEYAFSGCSGLTSLSIPSGVTGIGWSAFSGCSGLTSVHYQINDDFETYLSKGHLYIIVDCGIEYYLNDKKITSVVIPSTITELGHYAFQKCKDLTSVYVSWQSPISAGSAFSDVDISKCTLYVPQGTEQDYWLTDVWGDFGRIVEYDPTGIDKVTTSTDAKEVSRYSVNGQRLSAPTKGLNLVKYSDGSVKKVAVQ